MHFHTSAEHRALNSKECSAFKYEKGTWNLEIGFRTAKRIHEFMSKILFPVHINVLAVNSQIECTELQPDIQHKNMTTSLYQTS